MLEMQVQTNQIVLKFTSSLKSVIAKQLSARNTQLSAKVL